MIIDINDKSLTTENDDFWIAPDATIIGDVQMGKRFKYLVQLHP